MLILLLRDISKIIHLDPSIYEGEDIVTMLTSCNRDVTLSFVTDLNMLKSSTVPLMNDDFDIGTKKD